MKTKPVANVPTMLPTVDQVKRFPVTAPRLPSPRAASFTAKGVSVASTQLGAANSNRPANTGPERRLKLSSIVGSRNPLKAGTRATRPAPPSMSIKNSLLDGFWSASLPPME